MRPTAASALFIGEGTSDRPLVDLVASVFLDHGVQLRVSAPDPAQLPGKIGHRTDQKLDAALRLFDGLPDLLIIHRDADPPGPASRRQELMDAVSARAAPAPLVPIVPVRMTEAWLLLDHDAIRRVAGNPRGRARLDLPPPRTVEDASDPKLLLREALVTASEATGRRRAEVVRRFPAHRRQLLERLDRAGPLTTLTAYRVLLHDVETVAEHLRTVTAR